MRRAAQDERPQAVGDRHQLVHPDPVEEPDVCAEVATGTVDETAGRAVRPERGEESAFLCGGLEVLAAVQAHPADQPLGQHSGDRRGHEEVLDPHVQQPVQCRRGVGRVQRGQYEVSGQSGLDGDSRGVGVADLADEDHIRVLPQDGLETAGEGDPGLLVDLDLVDPGHGVLDRVLDGHDVALGAVQLAERAVERGGLAAAGRPGADDHAVRRLQHSGVARGHRLGHAELRQPEQRAALVQQPEDDLFPADHRRTRDPDVHRAAFDLHADLAVLRASPLDDVHPTEDLDPARHRRAHRAGQVEDVVQDAVDAVADAQPVGLRFEVHVGGAVAQGLGDHQRNDVDDRGVVARGRGCVGLGVPTDRVAGLECPDLLLDAGERAVSAADGGEDVRAVGEGDVHRAPERLAQRGDSGAVRLGDRDQDRVALQGQRNRTELAGLRFGEQRGRGRLRAHRAQIDGVRAPGRCGDVWPGLVTEFHAGTLRGRGSMSCG